MKNLILNPTLFVSLFALTLAHIATPQTALAQGADGIIDLTCTKSSGGTVSVQCPQGDYGTEDCRCDWQGFQYAPGETLDCGCAAPGFTSQEEKLGSSIYGKACCKEVSGNDPVLDSMSKF